MLTMDDALLIHYGVKGMSWKKKKTPAQLEQEYRERLRMERLHSPQARSANIAATRQNRMNSQFVNEGARPTYPTRPTTRQNDDKSYKESAKTSMRRLLNSEAKLNAKFNNRTSKGKTVRDSNKTARARRLNSERNIESLMNKPITTKKQSFYKSLDSTSKNMSKTVRNILRNFGLTPTAKKTTSKPASTKNKPSKYSVGAQRPRDTNAWSPKIPPRTPGRSIPETNKVQNPRYSVGSQRTRDTNTWLPPRTPGRSIPETNKVQNPRYSVGSQRTRDTNTWLPSRTPGRSTQETNKKKKPKYSVGSQRTRDTNTWLPPRTPGRG